MRGDGMISQLEIGSGATSLVRLVPFFFEYEAGPGRWVAITEPEALTALTALLSSSSGKAYSCTTPKGVHTYRAELANEQGLVLQTNTASGTMRSVRASPVGPDGAAHFEFLEEETNWRPGLSNWSPVASEITPMIAGVAAGHGDAHYMCDGHTYKASLTADGFIDQKE